MSAFFLDEPAEYRIRRSLICKSMTFCIHHNNPARQQHFEVAAEPGCYQQQPTIVSGDVGIELLPESEPIPLSHRRTDVPRPVIGLGGLWIVTTEQFLVGAKSAGRHDHSAGGSDIVSSLNTTDPAIIIGQQFGDSCIENEVNAAGPAVPVEHFDNPFTCTFRTMTSWHRTHARSIHPFGPELDPKAHQPFESWRRQITVAPDHRRLDQPLIQRHVMFVHRIGGITFNTGHFLQRGSRGIEVTTAQTRRSADLFVCFHHQHA